jgi:hypothetical protein
MAAHMCWGAGIGAGVGGGGVGEAVGDAGGVAVGARITKLTVGVEVTSLVTQPVQLETVKRSHLCAAVMDPAVGYASYILAASPETCGQAMDVPVAYRVWVSLSGPVERTLVPGA